MSNIVLISILTVSAIGILAALILYIIAQKFKVYEDPRIDDVEGVLPGANCGGCGYPGCRGFAEACVKADNLDDLYCPVGGNECSVDIANILGKEAAEKAPLVAVVRCNGTPQNSVKVNKYDGAANCTIASALYTGETACQYGCLGYGECVEACTFDAMYMDQETGLPVINDEKCTACGACVTTCPRNIIELRKKAKKDRKIFVSCVNQDKGAQAKKACSVACIGCSKCKKVCKFDAITIENFLAYIDSQKCTLCRKCVEECPTNAIWEVNFPIRKAKKELPKKEDKIKKEDLKTEDKITEKKIESKDDNKSDNTKTIE